MNRIQRTRRVAAALTGLALTWLVLATAAPAAFARVVPAQGGPGEVAPAATRTILVGGTPCWQIALIAAAAALFAAGLAVLADRAWTAHRKTALSPT
jgi:hypothetical protein